jgi:hypothetical protein
MGAKIMAIPNTIVTFKSGIVGAISHESPTRASGVLLDSTIEDLNVFGRAFTTKSSDNSTVEAGGAGVFAGLLINTAGQAVDTVYGKNGSQQQLLEMGKMFVEVEGTPVVGSPVYFIPATGVLTTVATNNTLIKTAVITNHTPNQKLAVITITGLQA